MFELKLLEEKDQEAFKSMLAKLPSEVPDSLIVSIIRGCRLIEKKINVYFRNKKIEGQDNNLIAVIDVVSKSKRTANRMIKEFQYKLFKPITSKPKAIDLDDDYLALTEDQKEKKQRSYQSELNEYHYSKYVLTLTHLTNSSDFALLRGSKDSRETNVFGATYSDQQKKITFLYLFAELWHLLDISKQEEFNLKAWNECALSVNNYYIQLCNLFAAREPINIRELIKELSKKKEIKKAADGKIILSEEQLKQFFNEQEGQSQRKRGMIKSIAKMLVVGDSNAPDFEHWNMLVQGNSLNTKKANLIVLIACNFEKLITLGERDLTTTDNILYSLLDNSFIDENAFLIQRESLIAQFFACMCCISYISNPSERLAACLFFGLDVESIEFNTCGNEDAMYERFLSLAERYISEIYKFFVNNEKIYVTLLKENVGIKEWLLSLYDNNHIDKQRLVDGLNSIQKQFNEEFKRLDNRPTDFIAHLIKQECNF